MKELRPLTSLQETATHRKPGYLDRCLELSEQVIIEGKEFRKFSPENWVKIRQEFALPGLLKMAGNAIVAGARAGTSALRGEPVKASLKMVAAREAICHACPEYIGADDRCSKCGCGMTKWIGAKVGLATERCPIGKWERELPKPEDNATVPS